jgi:hypothetical protein
MWQGTVGVLSYLQQLQIAKDMDEIDLSHMMLLHMPFEITYLTNLTKLDLDNNRFAHPWCMRVPGGALPLPYVARPCIALSCRPGVSSEHGTDAEGLGRQPQDALAARAHAGADPARQGCHCWRRLLGLQRRQDAGVGRAGGSVGARGALGCAADAR